VRGERRVDAAAAPRGVALGHIAERIQPGSSRRPHGHRAESNQEAGVHAVIETRRQDVEALCRTLGIRRLDVFGSAVSDSFDIATSDIHVLVEFDAARPGFDYFGTYFALKEAWSNS
jgi:predicted nucleotidyltransferase